jgi:hypothetical protein
MLQSVRERLWSRESVGRLPSAPELWALAAIAIGAIAVVLGLIAFVDHRMVLRSADRSSQLLALAFEYQTGRTVSELDRELVAVADLVRDGAPTSEVLDLRLKADQADMLQDHLLAVLNAGGLLVSASSTPVHRGLDLSDRDLVRSAIKEPEQGLMVGQSPGPMVDQRSYIGLARRIVDGGGALIGVVYAGLDPTYVDHFTVQAGLPAGSVVMVLRDDGSVLARRPQGDGWIGQSLAADALFLQFDSRRGAGTYHEIAADDRIERVTTYRSVDGYPLVVALGVPVDAALADWRGRAFDLLLVWAVVSAGIALAAAACANRAQRRRENVRRGLY